MRQKLTVAGVLILLLFLLRFPTRLSSPPGRAWLCGSTLCSPILLPFYDSHRNPSSFRKPGKTFGSLYLFSGKNSWGSPPGAPMFLSLACSVASPWEPSSLRDLYAAGKISRREAEYLLTFANNPSPSFLLSYLAASCLGGRTSGREILAILFCLPCCACCFSALWYTKPYHRHTHRKP